MVVVVGGDYLMDDIWSVVSYFSSFLIEQAKCGHGCQKHTVLFGLTTTVARKLNK